MLTDMKMIPQSHLGMSGSIPRLKLAYTTVLASALAIIVGLGRCLRHDGHCSSFWFRALVS